MVFTLGFLYAYVFSCSLSATPSDNFGLLGYFGNCRRQRNRSLLNVNEDFEAKLSCSQQPSISPIDNFGLLSYFEAARRG